MLNTANQSQSSVKRKQCRRRRRRCNSSDNILFMLERKFYLIYFCVCVCVHCWKRKILWKERQKSIYVYDDNEYTQLIKVFIDLCVCLSCCCCCCYFLVIFSSLLFLFSFWVFISLFRKTLNV